jgi:hypothetical protein
VLGNTPSSCPCKAIRVSLQPWTAEVYMHVQRNAMVYNQRDLSSLSSTKSSAAHMEHP